MNANAQTGFTLLELMITLLVAGIVLTVGIPNFMEFQRNSAMTAAANELVTGVLMARSEAVKRQVPITLCLSDNPIAANPTCLPNQVADSNTRGFIVWVDENGNPDVNGVPNLTDATDGNGAIDAGEVLLRQSVTPGGAILVSANCGHVGYGPNGFQRPIGALCAPATRTILFCDDRGNRTTVGDMSAARVVRIDQPGRGQVLQALADVTSAITTDLAAVNPTCPSS